MRQTDYLVVGHLAKDVGWKGFSIGGSVVYAGATAARLGRQVAVVTACEPGLDLQRILHGTPVAYAPSLRSTVFENIYSDGNREQYLHSRAAGIGPAQVPLSWRRSRLVHIAPIAQELTADIVDIFQGSFIGLTAQGWLRGWDATGKVFYKPWAEAAKLLPKMNAVVLSEEDVDFRADVVAYFATLAPVVAVTLGDRGAKVHCAGAWHHLPAFPARAVDPTGAGDVFAAAFFHRLEQTKDPIESAVFANCAGSFSVEAAGRAGLPTLDMLEGRIKGAG